MKKFGGKISMVKSEEVPFQMVTCLDKLFFQSQIDDENSLETG